MNKINKLQDELPDTSHVFQIDLIGRITKKRYLGEFSCKIPTIRDQALIGKHEAAMNGEFPVYLDGGIRKIHKMISYLRFTLTDVPKFWRDSDLGYDLRDDNIIDAVYAEVMSFEEEWLKKIWGTPEEPSGTDEAEEDKKRVDPYVGVKYLGYRMSQLPDRYKMSDLIRYARFQLAEKAGRLYKDPIFDTYTVEELLAEFFAHQFVESKEFRLRFEAEIGDVEGEIDDFASWADKKIAEEAKIRDKTIGAMEDNVSFDPSMVMGEE